MENTYASIIESPIGKITIIADDDFISEVTFSEKEIDELLESELTKRVATQLMAYFKGELKVFDFPMKQKGSEFHRRFGRIY
ncbi:hypothetical protein [Pedobacter jamesrossensis]|uniref:Methylguanine DNA methyltransferase ribonuclease-like domain-containing protein n=1 Tax=Pedobacter jamesrossensis TaxID=1908238 RepID=A0ABV8NKL4_9SPHI